MECLICNKFFKSHRGLNGHKRIHGESEGTYSVSRKKTVHLFNCTHCGISKEYNPASSKGKYCSTKCQTQYQWLTVTRPHVISGGGGSGMKRYLIEEFGYACSHCALTNWLDDSIVLQLDHIDGNSDNNCISNIRLLCPNCHSQTSTFCGRNTKNTKRNSYLQVYKKINKQTRTKMVAPDRIELT